MVSENGVLVSFCLLGYIRDSVEGSSVLVLVVWSESNGELDTVEL